MRTLRRNKQKIYYALYSAKTDAIDAQGFFTGESVKTYGDPVALKINVSPAEKNLTIEPFGTATDYSHTMVTCDMDCPIDEETILWIGKEPYTDDNPPVLTAHNYRVVRVAKSLNNIMYAIREAEISASDSN